MAVEGDEAARSIAGAELTNPKNKRAMMQREVIMAKSFLISYFGMARKWLLHNVNSGTVIFSFKILGYVMVQGHQATHEDSTNESSAE